MAEIIIAFVGFAGSAAGAVAGIFINTKLINYRIEQLEIKVNKHNKLIERTYELETNEKVLEEQIKAVNHRIEDLENSKPVSVVSDNKYLKEH
ncbi:MAG: hypothetical protein Q4D26_09075 [Clostridia bacterium]|nr:hypothetical protein [Clostridia bacterium]